MHMSNVMIRLEFYDGSKFLLTRELKEIMPGILQIAWDFQIVYNKNVGLQQIGQITSRL